MKKIKILHCGDIHFDTPFKELKNELAKKSKEELKEVFNKIIDLCNKEKVSIMLLGGDLFDNYTVSRNTLTFIKDAFSRLEETRVFISPGNHDPYNFKSFYKLIEWPKNVYIFKGELEKVFLEDLGVNVYGAAFNDNYVNESLIKGIKDIQKEKDLINLLLIHGEISNGGGNEYNPLTLKEIKESGMDYIALGHRHKFNGVLREGDTSYAYSGCPQGRGFDELDDKGVLLGEVSKGYVHLSFVKTSKRRYFERDINITGFFGYREVKKKILDELKEENLKEDIFKINLLGELEATFKIDEKMLEDKLEKDFYFLKVKDKTTIKVDLDSVENENSIKGIFVKNIKEKINTSSEEEKEIMELALKLGLQSLSEEEVNLDDY